MTARLPDSKRNELIANYMEGTQTQTTKSSQASPKKESTLRVKGKLVYQQTKTYKSLKVLPP